MKPQDTAYLHHILDSIQNIEVFRDGIVSEADLRKNLLKRAGIERMLTIIGEAVKHLY